MTSSKPFSKPDVTLSLAPSSSALSSPSSPANINRTPKPEERGLRLIQLLLKCANHASSGNLHRADTCLYQIFELSSTSGDSLQRLAAHFASALAVRLVKRWPGLYKALNHDQRRPSINLARARSLFSRAFPYLSFTYTIIARTLLHAMSHEHVIHVVDMGSCDSNLWVPLIRSFAHLPNGPPYLKITCLNSDKSLLDKLGHRLMKEAETFDMPFQFNPLTINLKDLTIDMLKVRSGEALAFISILNLHVLLAEDDRVDAHFGGNKTNNNDLRNCKQLGDFLSMVQSLSPKLLFLLEQEADHNLSRLADRFVEGLHYYSAVFDSIDATLGKLESEDKVILEDMFGREIENIVACEGLERYERYERYDKWVIRLTKAGFKPVRMLFNIDEAKQMVGDFGKGYKIVDERSSFMICWHERPLYAVTAWNC